MAIRDGGASDLYVYDIERRQQSARLTVGVKIFRRGSATYRTWETGSSVSLWIFVPVGRPEVLSEGGAIFGSGRAARKQTVQSLPISAMSHPRASRQSRVTVPSETFSTAAVSSKLSPPK